MKDLRRKAIQNLNNQEHKLLVKRRRSDFLLYLLLVTGLCSLVYVVFRYAGPIDGLTPGVASLMLLVLMVLGLSVWMVLKTNKNDTK